MTKFKFKITFWRVVAAIILLAGAVATFQRFVYGLGAATNLSDDWPWGLWIGFDVISGVGLAAGGFTITAIVYIFNLKKYHCIVKPTVLTAFMGYVLVGVALLWDLGKYFDIWHPLVYGNHHSPMFELAVCVATYTCVLALEFTSFAFGKFKFMQKPVGFLKSIYILLVIMGVLISTLHQSSLGTVILLGGPKLHPLWNTPLVPLLFLISCIGMGYAVVVFEGALAARLFKRKREDEMLSRLGGVMALLTGLFLVIRFVDLVFRGRFGLMFRDGYSLLFWIEMVVFALPMIMLWKNRGSFRTVFQASVLLLLAGGLYRFDIYLVAFNPGPQWSYFPILPELIVSAGIVALEIFLYVWFVKRFPILPGGSSAEKA